jgi:prepilin-type N-terminal cleavage/methylation domain-containing protein/prepilin-type processing-associated H-X9-DG protein
MKPEKTTKAGFTLIELLVVIAIIAILAGMLLPALSQAKRKAQTAQCLNNLKQLMVCWHLYPVDNNDVLVPNNSVNAPPPIPPLLKGASWALADPTEVNVREGLLFGYNSSLGIYHCPSDRSILAYGSEGFDREAGANGGRGLLRSRSYNMSLSINGYPDFSDFIYTNVPMFTKFSQIGSPNTDRCLVFIDEHESTMMDSQFGMPTDFFPGDPATPFGWWDQPANRHGRGSNLSFADGHVEHWQWKVPLLYTYFGRNYTPDEERDWLRIKSCIKQQKD